MRRNTIAFAATVGLAAGFVQLASAADLPYKAPRVAPVPYVVPFTWTGFYIGAHVGGAWGTKEWTNTLAGARFVDDWQHNINGYLGGLQVGANYQFDRWVIGAEAQFSWANLDGKNHCSITGRDLNCSTQSDWLSTAALRFGFTKGDWLAYIKGGAAWVSDEHTFTQFVPNASISVSANRRGWMVGTGIEYAVSSNWSAKIEYNYLDFGTETVHFPDLASVLLIQNLSDEVSIRQRIHLVKAGVNYRFNWGKAPVAAMY
jgi:outer membrane immunogenic protein